jgi:hypothetical protein
MASATSVSMSVNERMLAFLRKTEGYNTFSVKQAQRRFGIRNVSARIAELRRAGHPIYTNIVKNSNGERVAMYRLGTPTKSQSRNRFYSRLRSA